MNAPLGDVFGASATYGFLHHFFRTNLAPLSFVQLYDIAGHVFGIRTESRPSYRMSFSCNMAPDSEVLSQWPLQQALVEYAKPMG